MEAADAKFSARSQTADAAIVPRIRNSTMTMTTWHSNTPPAPGWYVTDGDDDLRRHFNGRAWSPPVHADDLDRLGERVRLMPAEPRSTAEPITWRDA